MNSRRHATVNMPRWPKASGGSGAAFASHVAGGVDVNQPADSGDYEEHDHGEVVDLEIEAGAEISGDDPGEVLLDPRDIFWSELREFADGFKRGQEREAGGTDGDG